MTGGEDIVGITAKARQGLSVWKNIPIRQRLASLGRLADTIVERMDDISNRMAHITGKTPVEVVLTELIPTLENLRYLEKNAERILAPEKRKTPFSYRHSTSYMTHYPWGVVLILSPWNFPFQLSLIPVITALAAGNAVILKMSEITPAVGDLLQELFNQAGFPPDVINIIKGDAQSGERLIEARPDMIFLTGSSTTGKKVMATASRHLIPVILELGGKDPMIVFDDAPFERTVNGAVYGAFANAGQVCVAVERLYLQEGIYDRFVKAVVQKVRTLRVGGSMDHDIGAMTSPRQIEIVNGQIDEALQKGAILQTDRRVDGQLMHPVVLTNVNHTMKIMTEETFGPVLPIQKFKTESEVIALANDSPLGLNASIWTQDLKRGQRVAAQLEVGNCAINDVLKNIGNPYASFGGVKQSGVGRYHGPEGLRSFCRPMAVMVNKGTAKKELNWFPYSRQLYENLRIYLNISFLNKPLWVKLKGLWGFIKAYRNTQNEERGSHGK
ncbi:MAG: Aldehyde dehydrogenase [Elusimicrobia bacterium]|nr:Aldehyde dehydrogenase [Elusimicrobiota bacterium]